MAGKITKKLKNTKLTIPSRVVDSDWRDDVAIDNVDYATYGNETEESEYVSPTSISRESLKKIKSIKLNSSKFLLAGNKMTA